MNFVNQPIWQWEASDIAQATRSGAVSCREVVTSFWERIDAVNPELNAVVEFQREQSLETATQADANWLRDPSNVGPLHGVPMTIKLNTDVAGEATHNGVPAYTQKVAHEDSAVVTNLRRAGAIILGRSNVPPFNYRWFTENTIYGRTWNPWSRDITSGGSSGGAAVAVSMGLCALSHGTDIAGSIRYPAYVNGVAGLRPTPGRVPSYSATMTQRFAGLQLLSAHGPLARSVQDIELGLRVMAADGATDPTWLNVPIDYPDDSTPARVAMVRQMPNTTISSSVQSALAQAAQALESAGYVVEEAVPPCLQEAHDAWFSIVINEVRLGMMKDVEATKDPAIIASVEGMAAPATEHTLASYATALARRDSARRQWLAFLQQYPLVLMPTSCAPPMVWDADLQGVEAMQPIIAQQSGLMSIATLGVPGLHVPTGLNDGIPTGVQLVAAPFREMKALAAGRIIESAAAMPRPWP